VSRSNGMTFSPTVLAKCTSVTQTERPHYINASVAIPGIVDALGDATKQHRLILIYVHVEFK